MKTVKIYLDNCCYNRPFDDQSQIRIFLEAQAKMYIQELIRTDKIELVSSYMMIYESSRNPSETKRTAIRRFMEDYSTYFVDESFQKAAESIADEIQKTGVKPADSLHVACAILAKCDYFITTDDRLRKYKTDNISIVDPVEFIQKEGRKYDGTK